MDNSLSVACGEILLNGMTNGLILSRTGILFELELF
jgi:hypothetical protein